MQWFMRNFWFEFSKSGCISRTFANFSIFSALCSMRIWLRREPRILRSQRFKMHVLSLQFSSARPTKVTLHPSKCWGGWIWLYLWELCKLNFILDFPWTEQKLIVLCMSNCWLKFAVSIYFHWEDMAFKRQNFWTFAYESPVKVNQFFRAYANVGYFYGQNFVWWRCLYFSEFSLKPMKNLHQKMASTQK